MLQLLQDHVLSALAAGVLGLLTFLVRHYFGTLRKDIANGQKDFSKIEGHLDALRADIRANTVELARTTTELKALWRWVDAPRRASDHSNGGGPP